MKQTEIVWVSCGINQEGILVPGSGVPANMAAWRAGPSLAESVLQRQPNLS